MLAGVCKFDTLKAPSIHAGGCVVLCCLVVCVVVFVGALYQQYVGGSVQI